jgi:polyferredoxin
MPLRTKLVKTGRVDLLLAVLAVLAVTFYVYSASGIFIGAVFAVVFALATWAMLALSRPYRTRSIMVTGLTVTMWIAFASFLLQIGSAYIGNWLVLHQKTPLTPLTVTNYGYVSILCPYLLPTSIGGPIRVTMPLYVSFLSTFPPTIATFAVIVGAYLATALILGKGWCGWLCPFGGIGEALRMRHKPLKAYSRLMVRVKAISKGRGVDLSGQEPGLMMRDVKYAFLVVTLLLSVVYTVQWFCVFCWAGVLGWFTTPVNFYAFVAIMGALFIGLPLLSTKKWCHSICPVGAGLSVIDRATPFRIAIDRESCSECYACMNVCPTFGFAKEVDGSVSVTDTCDKCLTCLDKCPTGAIDLKMYGVKTDAEKFLVPAATVLGAFWFYWFVVVVFNLVALQVKI